MELTPTITEESESWLGISFLEMLKPVPAVLEDEPWSFEQKAWVGESFEEYEFPDEGVPQTFIPEEWGGPYLPSELVRIPRFSGIYAIITGRTERDRIGKLQYIGQAKSLYVRLRSHATLKLICQFFDDVEIFVKISRAEHLNSFEKSMIRNYEPPINFQHRVKESIRERQ